MAAVLRLLVLAARSCPKFSAFQDDCFFFSGRGSARAADCHGAAGTRGGNVHDVLP